MQALLTSPVDKLTRHWHCCAALHGNAGRHLRVLGTCAVNGAGFGEGLTWLAQCLSLAGRTTLSL
jgi:hypothetical protein